jgi:hypothetical protein
LTDAPTPTCVVHHAARRRADVAGAVVEYPPPLGHQAGEAAGPRGRRQVPHAAHARRWRPPRGRGPAQTRVRVAVAVRQTVLVRARTSAGLVGAPSAQGLVGAVTGGHSPAVVRGI